MEVLIADQGWLSACPPAEALVEEAARAALVGMPGGTVSILLTGDAEQQRLNRMYRGKDAATNVLAFPLDGHTPDEAPRLLGDVALACETIAREAAEQNKPVADHLRHLVVHGVLHLLGFDHESEADATMMEAREVEILHGLGVPDPYRNTI